MDDNLAIIGQIVSENANLHLVGGKALELVEVLSFYFNVGDYRIGFSVPESRIVIDDFEAFHVLWA